MPCLFGTNAAKIDNVSCYGYCCVYFLLSPLYLCGIIHMSVRGKMRAKYGLQEEPSDCVAACLLSPLAVCQEARELISREKISNGKVRTNQPVNDIATTADSEVESSAISSEAV